MDVVVRQRWFVESPTTMPAFDYSDAVMALGFARAACVWLGLHSMDCTTPA